MSDKGTLERDIRAFGETRRGGLIVLPDFLTSAYRDLIVGLELQCNIPSVHPFRYFSRVGGLLSYGVDLTDVSRRAANYADRILRGAKVVDLPIQSPTSYELVINLKTAKALHIDIPPILLAQADEIIE